MHLGPTVLDVARTKARIAAPGGILVSGEAREDRLTILLEEGAAVGATVWEPGGRFAWAGDDRAFSYRGPHLELRDVPLGLQGPHQAQNAACALAAVEALHQLRGTPVPTAPQAARALTSTWLAGRMEEVPSDGVRPQYLLDGAHNPAAAEVLSRAITRRSRPLRRWWLLASKRDKRLDEILDLLLPHVDGVVCTAGRTSDKFVPPERLAERVVANPNAPRMVRTAPHAPEALALLHAELGPADEVLVAGSLYLVGDVRPLLGLPVA
jgi:dihydrofolate synthase/folylpolyglutamate synthase